MEDEPTPVVDQGGIDGGVCSPLTRVVVGARMGDVVDTTSSEDKLNVTTAPTRVKGNVKYPPTIDFSGIAFKVEIGGVLMFY